MKDHEICPENGDSRFQSRDSLLDSYGEDPFVDPYQEEKKRIMENLHKLPDPRPPKELTLGDVMALGLLAAVPISTAILLWCLDCPLRT